MSDLMLKFFGSILLGGAIFIGFGCLILAQIRDELRDIDETLTSIDGNLDFIGDELKREVIR